MSDREFRPLEGTRVIDLTSNMSGPLATMVLADQGAEVIKVEPLAGDLIRTVGTGRGGMSAYFANLNRGKRSIAVDLSTEAGVGRRASAVVHRRRVRPELPTRGGRAPRPRSRRAHGRQRAADLRVDQRLRTRRSAGHRSPPTTTWSRRCRASRPSRPAPTVPTWFAKGAIDKASAYTLAQAITAALLQRVTTGRGVRIDVSMLDVALAFLWPDGMMNDTCVGTVEVLPPVSRSFRTTPDRRRPRRAGDPHGQAVGRPGRRPS